MKLRKKLEQDLKKLKEKIVELCANFDNKIFVLFNKRLEYQYRIYEHENAIIKLMQSIHNEKKMDLAISLDEKDLHIIREALVQNGNYKSALENTQNDLAMEVEKKAGNRYKSLHYENYIKLFGESEEKKAINELIEDNFLKFLERNSELKRRLNDMDLFFDMETVNLKRQAVYDIEPYKIQIKDEEKRSNRDGEAGFRRFLAAIETERRKKKELETSGKLAVVLENAVKASEDLKEQERSLDELRKEHLRLKRREQDDIYIQMRFLNRMVEVPVKVNQVELEGAILIPGATIHEANDTIKEKGLKKASYLIDLIKNKEGLEEEKHKVLSTELEIEELIIESMGISRLKVTKELQAALSEDKEMEVA